jgi:hypothetical protein
MAVKILLTTMVYKGPNFKVGCLNILLVFFFFFCGASFLLERENVTSLQSATFTSLQFPVFIRTLTSIHIAPFSATWTLMDHSRQEDLPNHNP